MVKVFLKFLHIYSQTILNSCLTQLLMFVFFHILSSSVPSWTLASLKECSTIIPQNFLPSFWHSLMQRVFMSKHRWRSPCQDHCLVNSMLKCFPLRCGKVHQESVSFCLWPYHPECTQSHLISEAKQDQVGLVST